MPSLRELINPDLCLPIIYVRGYAMSEGERDDTTADPFCGFNLGSTVFRPTTDRKKPRKFIFESPALRLIKDYGYEFPIEQGVDPMDDRFTGDIPQRSIIILRYYDDGSSLLGDGKPKEIIEYGKRLSRLIDKLRSAAAKAGRKDFGVYLVAHSMGGLVCRVMLQNNDADPKQSRDAVRKFFTYATPHNGIDIAGVNVPSWLSLNDMNNFSRTVMRGYLKLTNVNPSGADKDRADWIPEERFPSKNIFCLIGSNDADYSVAAGMSRRMAGTGSDGLVRIENASVWGVSKANAISEPCATAYLHRSHSGFFGIVNSEEGYQNLTRFLFGSMRVDIWLDITETRVPKDIQAKDKQGKIDALYQVELTATPRAKPWFLTRRLVDDNSAACVKHSTLRKKKISADNPHSVYLSTVFLD